MKLSSGSAVIDTLLNGGYEKDVITTVYGPAGSGKTTLALLAAVSAAKQGKRVIFIDTEGGFSTERLQQLTPDHNEIINRFIFLKPTTFEKQKIAFDKLRSLIAEDIGLIIIDSIAMLYRLELGKADDVYGINRDLGRQIGYLTEIARRKNIPVLVTNQVYSNFDERSKINMVGGDILKYGSKCLLEIQKTPSKTRRILLKKHRAIAENKEAFFEIIETGLEEAKPLRGFKQV